MYMVYIYIQYVYIRLRFNSPTPSRTPINPLNTLPNLRFLPTSDESNDRSVDRSELLIAQTNRQPIIDHIIISNRRGAGVKGGGQVLLVLVYFGINQFESNQINAKLNDSIGRTARISHKPTKCQFKHEIRSPSHSINIYIDIGQRSQELNEYYLCIFHASTWYPVSGA